MSGIALTAYLAKALQTVDRRYSYRFLFIPETIGAIAWLSENHHSAHRIAHGLVATCVGDPGPIHYKRSRRGDAEIDRIVTRLLADRGAPHTVLDFFPSGSDERQYCSPGYNLPVGSIMRTPYGRFPEYHTSADNLSLVTPDALAESFALYWEVITALEANRLGKTTNPYCEPQLSKRNLYPTLGGQRSLEQEQIAIGWILNLSDGTVSLLDIAERAHLPFWTVVKAASRLYKSDLLEWT